MNLSTLGERGAPARVLGEEAVAELLTATREPRALPGLAYTSPELFEWERQRIFQHGWVPVGRVADYADKGSQAAVMSAGRNVLVAGTGEGVNVFVNACRHRGHELVTQSCKVRRAQVWCAYHAWVYGLDGALRSAPRFEELAETDPRGLGLLPVRSAEWNGWLFVNHSGDAPNFPTSLGNLTTVLDAYQLGELRRVGTEEYEVEANWKLIVENYLECYHCPSTHPELSKVQRTVNGEGFTSTGLWLGGSLDLKNSADTMSLNGSGPTWAFPKLDEDRARQVCYYAVLPGLFITAMHDYVVTHRLDPLAPDRTRVICEWFFSDELLDSRGFKPDYAVDFWKTTNLQDWAACSSTQRGVSDSRYVAGPLAPNEEELRTFLQALADAYERDAGLRPLWSAEEHNA
ncbi:aromatic ring-hydroxylating oxygenase subunit alpha [Kitasatospora sp. LaBMicrA B282]|uniref:aromatic ring-hydroxylating oxygenase subunit alpha n=1 Tax=Kitasatospora sp. LaBMicrA B282 TaxID=3420949 RepID=UPI003D0D9424